MGGSWSRVTLDTRGSWDNHLHWWAHSQHRQSLATPAEARRARLALVRVPECEVAEVPIELSRTYEPLSFAPHGGGPAYLYYQLRAGGGVILRARSG